MSEAGSVFIHDNDPGLVSTLTGQNSGCSPSG